MSQNTGTVCTCSSTAGSAFCPIHSGFFQGSSAYGSYAYTITYDMSDATIAKLSKAIAKEIARELAQEIEGAKR